MRIQWKKLSKEEISNIGKERFGNKYSYNNVDVSKIKNVRSKISITCNTCSAIFLSTIENHFIAKRNCKNCAMKEVGHKKYKSGKYYYDLLKNKELKNHNFDSLNLIDKLNRSDEVIFFCNNHDIPIVCKRSLNNLLQGYGCFICTNGNKINSFIFKEKAKKIHNNKYNYSLVNDMCFTKGANSKLPIICKEHGKFYMTYNSHINSKSECKKCSIKINRLKKMITLEEFLNKSKNHPYNKNFSYEKLTNNYSFDYKFKVKDSVPILCKTHNYIFYPSIDNFLNKHTGCSKCSKVFKINVNDFIKRAHEIHDNKYNYSLISVIKNNLMKINIICRFHKKEFIFKQSVSNHLRGHGCPKCTHRISKNEFKWLNLLNIKQENRQISLPGLSNYIKVDGYDPDTNTVYEFYGDYWHGNLNKFAANDLHPVRKKTFGEVYKNTLKKENSIKKAGYNLVSIWESDFKKQLK